MALRRLEAKLGLVAAAVQAGDAGGVFQHAAALLRRGIDDLADPALAHQRRRARAGRGVLEQQPDVARAHVLAVDPIGRARLALDAPRHFQHVAVVELGRREPRAVVDEQRHLGACCAPGGLCAPAKITSSMAVPRMLLYEVSPMAQRSASSRFDLPQPFGPTTPVSPCSIRSSVGSTNDLNPRRRRSGDLHAGRCLIGTGRRVLTTAATRPNLAADGVIRNAGDQEACGSIRALISFEGDLALRLAGH